MTLFRGVNSGLRNDFDDIIRALDDLSSQLKRILSKGLNYSDNMDFVSFSVADSGNADTAIKINHGLGRTIIGMHISNQDKAGSVYTSGSSFGNASGTVIFCSASNMKMSGYFF